MLEKILITGGAGFIGCNLACSLNMIGYEVVVVDDLSLGRADNLPPTIPLLVGDVADRQTWNQIPQVSAIVHLAGASSTPMFTNNLTSSFRSTIIGFLQMLEYARKLKCRRVVYISTSLIYGNAPSPLKEDGPIDIQNFYAVSKYCLEQIAKIHQQQYGMDLVGLRLMSIYGPREEHKGLFANLVSQFVWAIKEQRPVTIYGDGSQTRDFTCVEDVVQAIRLTLEYPNTLKSTIFNVGTGHSTSLNDLVEILFECTGVYAQKNYIQNPYGQYYNQHQLACLERITRVLEYRPSVSLREGILRILEHYTERST